MSRLLYWSAWVVFALGSFLGGVVFWAFYSTGLASYPTLKWALFLLLAGTILQNLAVKLANTEGRQ